MYHSFDQVLLLSHGRALYCGLGGFSPASHFSSQGITYHEGYNVADYLLEIASDPPVSLFQSAPQHDLAAAGSSNGNSSDSNLEKKQPPGDASPNLLEKGYPDTAERPVQEASRRWWSGPSYATTFLTQLEVLSGREWKILRRLVANLQVIYQNSPRAFRDLTLFATHMAVASVLGVFVGKSLRSRQGEFPSMLHLQAVFTSTPVSPSLGSSPESAVCSSWCAYIFQSTTAYEV